MGKTRVSTIMDSFYVFISALFIYPQNTAMNRILFAAALLISIPVSFADYTIPAGSTEAYNSDTMGGVITVESGGTLRVSGGTIWSGTTPTIIINGTGNNGGAIQSTANSTIRSAIKLASDSYIANNNAGTLTLQGGVSGDYALSKNGGYSFTIENNVSINSLTIN